VADTANRFARTAQRKPTGAPLATAPKEFNRRLTIDITEDLYRQLKARAAGEGVTMAQLLRPLIQRFLDDDALATEVITAAGRD
jgi:hypothetical protein